MTTASAQTESYGKDVSINSLKCNNINVNVNGLEFEVLPPALNALLTGGEVDASAYSYGSGSGNYDNASSSSENDFRFICINNNNNTIVEEPIQPEPTTGTLKVSKELTCGPFPLAPPEGAPSSTLCEDLLALITEDQFLFQVEGINPDPSSPFLGSPIGTDVRLDAGNYVVNEIVTQSVIEDAETFQANHPEVIGFGNQVTFIGDCNNLIGSFEATGTISAGESQTCNVINQYFLTVLPEPTTATLTVNKQVFGCDDFDLLPGILAMNCQDLQNTSTGWLNCNDNNPSDVIRFCQPLPESIFDIRVSDDQNNQIQEFEGSEQGTTIQNLEPGTYIVNEIKNPTNDDFQLGQNPSSEQSCVNAGFADGGELDNTTSLTNYIDICFEYLDEQDNDCSTITLAAGEERTCTVKNYIRFAFDS